MPGATAGVHTLLVNNKLITDKDEIEKNLKNIGNKFSKKKASSKKAEENLDNLNDSIDKDYN